MPVRVKCTLGIGGRLSGPPEDNEIILAELREIFPKDPPAQAGMGWPNGLVGPIWQIGFWDCAAEIGGKTEMETRIMFFVGDTRADSHSPAPPSVIVPQSISLS